jgi:hypothetical protein
LACASQQSRTVAGISENSDGRGAMFAAGIGACVGGSVMPGGSVTVVADALAIVLLGVISMWLSETDVDNEVP